MRYCAPSSVTYDTPSLRSTWSDDQQFYTLLQFLHSLGFYLGLLAFTYSTQKAGAAVAQMVLSLSVLGKQHRYHYTKAYTTYIKSSFPVVELTGSSLLFYSSSFACLLWSDCSGDGHLALQKRKLQSCCGNRKVMTAKQTHCVHTVNF